jgi:hypothetical protein
MDKLTEANFMILPDTILVRVRTTAEILTIIRPGINVFCNRDQHTKLTFMKHGRITFYQS